MAIIVTAVNRKHRANVLRINARLLGFISARLQILSSPTPPLPRRTSPAPPYKVSPLGRNNYPLKLPIANPHALRYILSSLARIYAGINGGHYA
jgi:hypothetical protein